MHQIFVLKHVWSSIFDQTNTFCRKYHFETLFIFRQKINLNTMSPNITTRSENSVPVVETFLFEDWKRLFVRFAYKNERLFSCRTSMNSLDQSLVPWSDQLHWLDCCSYNRGIGASSELSFSVQHLTCSCHSKKWFDIRSKEQDSSHCFLLLK